MRRSSTSSGAAAAYPPEPKEPMIRPTLLAAAAALAATACSAANAEARATDTATEIRRIHHAWLTRLAAGDPTACDLLTNAVRLRLVNGRDGACFMYVERFADSITPEERAGFAKVRVRRVRVKRNHATIYDTNVIVPPELADVDAINGKPMRFRRVDGRWRIDQIG